MVDTHQHQPASVLKYTERYKKPRVFVRAVESSRYTLTEQQRELRASVPRLIRPELGTGTSERWNILQPGDEPFRSQSLHVHFSRSNQGSAMKATGIKTRPSSTSSRAAAVMKCTMAKRYDWEVGDAVAVHNDGVPLRIKATDAYLHDIPPGSRSGRRWQMGDQVIYVIEGSGYDLHRDVEVEIADQYALADSLTSCL